MSDTRGIVHVGIDLGTSRSTISGSNGQRHMVESYVGWPVDLVARKLLKKRVLVGREAIEKRSMLDLRRPLERGVIKGGVEKDEVAVHELLQHLIAQVREDLHDQDLVTMRAVIGAPAKALLASKQLIRNAMKGLADSLMIVSEPFAVAYGAEALMHTMVIDIGAGTTDFCVMKGRYPTDQDQRTIDMAGDTIDARLDTLIRERYPEAQFSIHMVRDWKEQWSFVGKPKEKALVTAMVHGKPTQLDITQDMRTACEGLVPAIAENMLDLLARVEPELQEDMRQNILLAGGSSLIRGLSDSLEKALAEVGGGSVRVIADPTFAGSEGALAIALDALDSDWDILSS